MRDKSPPPPLDGIRRLQPSTPADFFSTSTEDLRVSSPPYRPVASTSNLHLDSYEFPPSPAYYVSTTKVNEMPDEKAATRSLDEPEPHPNDYDTKSTRPTVHYNDALTRGVEPAPGYTRTDSNDLLPSSKASSIAGTDDEDSVDYDWSGEEDLVDEEAKFEERMGGSKPKRKGWGPKRILTSLFSTIIGSTFLAGILIVPGVIVQVYWYKPHPTPERLEIKDNVQAWLFWAAANLVISWYLAMIVDIIPVLVQFFISASWGHVSEFVKTRIEVYDSIKNNLKPLLYAASGWVSWTIIFGHIYNLYNTQNSDDSRAPYTNRLRQVVEFFFFFALVICIKRMLSHSIAFSFHRTAYKDRVEAVEEALSVIESLRQYRPKLTPRSARKSPGTRTPLFGSISFSTPLMDNGFSTPLTDKEHFNTLSGALRSATPPRGHKDYIRESEDDADTSDHSPVGASSKSWKGKGKKKARLSWLHGSEDTTHGTPAARSEHEMESYPLSSGPTSGSPLGESGSPYRYPPGPSTHPNPNTNADGEIKFVQAAKVLKNAVLHDARNLKGKNEGLGSMAWNISSTQEAKRLARAIYTQFKDRRRSYLLPTDFYPAFPDTAAAEAAFRVFDKDNNGDISRAEIKTTLVRVYKERRFLSRSMRDVGAALKTLDHIILLFAMIILFFISLSVFGVNVGNSLTSVYSIGIAASFIFKNSASSAFDAIVFLFVSHPYDTGDRCFIDQDVLVVKKVGLFATVFTRSDGTETYYFNSQLFTKFITNVRRSGKMFENLTMQVAWRTPLEKLDALEKMLNEWLSTEEKRWFEPSTSIAFQSIDYQRCLNLTISIGHNGNWHRVNLLTYTLQDWGLRWERKTAFHAAVLYYCRQLGIVYYESPIPVIYQNPHVPPSLPSPSGSPGIVDDDPTLQYPDEDEPEAKTMKPNMGFLPPPSTRSSHLSRARKSKSKKSAMRGMEG